MLCCYKNKNKSASFSFLFFFYLIFFTLEQIVSVLVWPSLTSSFSNLLNNFVCKKFTCWRLLSDISSIILIHMSHHATLTY